METILSDQSTNEPNKNELKKTKYAKHEDPRSIQDKNEPYKNGANTTENDKTKYDKTGQDEIGKNKEELHETDHDENEADKKDPNEKDPNEKDPNKSDANKNEDDHLTSNLPCLVFSTPGVAKLSEAAIAEHAREIAFLDDILALCPELHYTIGTLEIEGKEVLYRIQYWSDRMNIVATNPLDPRTSRRAILFALREEMMPGSSNTSTERD